MQTFERANERAAPLLLPELDLINALAEPVTYRGRRAVRVISESGRLPTLAILRGTDFQDGVIEFMVAGARRAEVTLDESCFVGVAFRARERGAIGESLVLRPEHARAEDQWSRNHAAQYESIPDHPWDRLRRESPAAFESYVDVEPGAWTQVRIVVSGSRAELFVHGAEQPCLVVNDLRLGPASRGAVAFRVGHGCEAHFADMLLWAAEDA